MKRPNKERAPGANGRASTAISRATNNSSIEGLQVEVARVKARLDALTDHFVDHVMADQLTDDQRLAIVATLRGPILREQSRQRRLEGARKGRETQARRRAAQEGGAV